MNKIVIYLIEDNPVDAKRITEDLNNRAKKKYNKDGYEYEFKPLEGTNKKNYKGQDWNFYDSEIIDRIQGKLSDEEKNGNKMGLLLDVLLTEKDRENSVAAYYPTASIAKDIYFEFYRKMPIHIITSLLMFGTQSEIIMGVDLSDSYIYKEALDYPFEDDIKVMFDKFRT